MERYDENDGISAAVATLERPNRTRTTTATRTRTSTTISKRLKKRSNYSNICKTNFKQFLFATITISVIIIQLNPFSDQANCAQGLGLKEKKVLKTVAKGLLIRNLSTKKNFLPLPVPIPVPIEINDPPVYLKGKPKYVTVYKPSPQKPVVKPTTVYHMPVYSPTYGYMMNTPSMYDSSGLAGDSIPYDTAASSIFKPSQPKQATYEADSSGSALGTINFTDYDDESGNYYIKNGRQQQLASRKRRYIAPSDMSMFKRLDLQTSASLPSETPAEEEESFYNDMDDSNRRHSRVKRQIYHKSTYEGPCYGFPLEVNIKSRIKMDRLFPIHGNSQYKKCVKVGRPLLPPVEDDSPNY